MELRDTVELMNSSDYKDRFKAEYYQAKIRCEKLEAMLDKWDKGELGFTPNCPRAFLSAQLQLMNQYMDLLETRAGIENIEL